MCVPSCETGVDPTKTLLDTGFIQRLPMTENVATHSNRKSQRVAKKNQHDDNQKSLVHTIRWEVHRRTVREEEEEEEED